MDIKNIGVDKTPPEKLKQDTTPRAKDVEFQREKGREVLVDNVANRSLINVVSKQSELPEDLQKIEARLFMCLEAKGRNNPLFNTKLKDLEEVFENYEDRVKVLSVIKNNSSILSYLDDFKITKENVKTFIALSEHISDEKLNQFAFWDLMRNDRLVNNLDTEGFIEYLDPLYDELGDYKINDSSNPPLLHFIATFFSSGDKDDIERGKTLIEMYKKDSKFYNDFFLEQVYPLKQEWRSIQERGLLDKETFGERLYYDEIICYSNLTDEEYKTAQDRDLFSLRNANKEKLNIKIGSGALTSVDNDITLFAKLKDEEWEAVKKYNLIENYSGVEICSVLMPLLNSPVVRNGKETNLLDVAVERGLVKTERTDEPLIKYLYIEKLAKIEDWDVIKEQNLLEVYKGELQKFPDYSLVDVSEKIAQLSTITDKSLWAKFHELGLSKYRKTEDIIQLLNLSPEKWERFVKEKDTTFADYNLGIGDLASLEDYQLERAQKDLFGKVNTATGIAKLAKLEDECYDYVVKNVINDSEQTGSTRQLCDSTVDVIVNFKDYIGKESLDGMRRSDVRKLLSLLMENKQNIEGSEFNFSRHEKALPIFKDGYGGVIKKVTDNLGVYKEDFEAKTQADFKATLLNLDLERLKDLAPEFAFVEKNIPELTKTLDKVTSNPKFTELSEQDKKILLTATIMEKVSDESLEDASFDASILTRRLGFTPAEVQKVQRIIEHSNAITDFMRPIKGVVEIETPTKNVLKLDARKLELDKIAFALKEGNTFELAQMLYSTKEQAGLSRILDKKVKARINEIKSDDFVLPQFDIKSWVAEKSKDEEWLKNHTFNGMLMIRRSELPDDFTMFVHCIDCAVATGGSQSANVSNFDMFSIPNDKAICASYISKDKGGTFGGIGLLVSTPNNGQMVGAGYDLYSFSKNIDSMIMEYYNDNGLISAHGAVLKTDQRKSVANAIKGILYGQENIDNPENIADYIKRMDRLKSEDKPVSLAQIKEIDEELYNAYVEYFSRPVTTRFSEDTLLREDYHNEVLINTANVDAYFTKYTDFTGREHWADSFFQKVPKEIQDRSRNLGIPIIMWD